MSGHSSLALHRVSSPPLTLLERARADLRLCETELTRWQNWRVETEAMVDLLRQAIAAANNNQFDDELYHTYKTIHTVLQGWYGKWALKGIFSATWTLLGQQRGLMRQTSEQARLAQRKQALEQEIGELKRERAAQGLENQDLKEALARSVAAEAKLAQSIVQLETALVAKDAIIAIHTSQIAQLKQENACLRAKNADLQRQLAEKNKPQDSPPRHSAPRSMPPKPKGPREGKAVAEGRMFGKGSPISQPSSTQAFSPKQSFSEDDYPSESLKGGHGELASARASSLS